MSKRKEITLRLSPDIAEALQLKADKVSLPGKQKGSRNALINEILEEYVYTKCILELRSIRVI